ncbi:MAG TPA: DNA polymerase [Methanosarcina sp.]|nr:DNA polymerase [Methanosarcina sp.]
MNIEDIVFGDTPVVEEEKKVSVKKAAEAETDAPSKPTYNTYEDYNYDDLLTYAGIDTYGTSKSVARMFPKLIECPEYKVSIGNGRVKTTRAPALIEVYEQCTQIIFDFICDLELAGINYDPVANRRLDKEMREEVILLEDRIFTKLGRKVNLDSSVVMSKLLYEELGFEAPHKTKSGADATDGGALLILAGLDPLSPGKYITPNEELQFLADMAKRKNLASVHRGFISTYMDDYLQPDGRIHALYNQFGTSTFRLSSSEPNLKVSWASHR